MRVCTERTSLHGLDNIIRRPHDYTRSPLLSRFTEGELSVYEVLDTSHQYLNSNSHRRAPPLARRMLVLALEGRCLEVDPGDVGGSPLHRNGRPCLSSLQLEVEQCFFCSRSSRACVRAGSLFAERYEALALL